MSSQSIRIQHRFAGPPDTANGGYVAGLLAARLSGPVEVTLRAPTPLERDLELWSDAESCSLRDGEQLLAEARRRPLDVDVPALPTAAEARRVEGRCRAFETHPFPGCFVCGPDRPPGDGLGLRPGWLAERSLVAAAWTPDSTHAGADGTVLPEFIWGALDCPSAFPLLEDPAAQRLEPMVLGRLHAEIEAPARAGETLVVCAWQISLEGRRGIAGTAILDTSGRAVARGRATWISLAPRSGGASA